MQYGAYNQGNPFIVSIQYHSLIQQSPIIVHRRIRMLKALVIDDDPIVRDFLHRILSKLGCVVSEAENGIQGEQLALQEQPDLILLDIMMPEQDGYQTCTN